MWKCASIQYQYSVPVSICAVVLAGKWRCDYNSFVTWEGIQMQSMKNNLEERTADFAARIISVCETIPSKRLKSGHLKDQLFRAGTSVAANYAEAEEPESREDFIHKMKIAMKELAEARCWLRILAASGYVNADRLAPLIAESLELTRMMGASVSTARTKMRQTRSGSEADSESV